MRKTKTIMAAFLLMATCGRCFVSLCLLLGIFSGFLARAQEGESGDRKVFRAGASVSNITPPLGKPIVGNYQSPLATHIHDELHARCLVLDDGATRLAFVIADNVGINREVLDEAKRQVEQATGLSKENILISATHTHSATSAGGEGKKRRGYHPEAGLDEYQTFLARRISDGVQVAINNLEPARIGWGVGKVPQHLFNRRWKMKTPVMNPFGVMESVVMNPGVANPNLLEPAGPTDPEVSFISVQSLTGRPIAVLGNYSLHYVGGVPNGHISADYFAVFADRLQELLKADRQDPPFVGMLSNGTSADVNNINFRGPAEKHPPYAKMRIVANDVADEVLRVYKTVQHRDWVLLKAAQTELKLNVRRATPEVIAFTENVLARDEDVKPAHPLEKIYAERVLQMEREWPDQLDIILQTFRIGDLGVAAIPFETFTETGLEIKAKSPFKPSFTISLANGSYGYLPTPGQHATGGYETWLTTNKVQQDATVKIVAALMALFEEMKGEKKSETTSLFNGKNLDGWYTFLKDRGRDSDPKNVFSVRNGLLYISGEEWGCITTDKEYENYKLTLEFKWGGKTHAPRLDKARDSGVLLHSRGEDGAYSGTWMHSIECQIIEGGTGDFIVVGNGTPEFSVTSPVEPEKQGGAYVYKRGGEEVTIQGGRINWYARDPAWKDAIGFRGQRDVENPVGEWNTMECIAKGGEIFVYLNGILVNYAKNVHPRKGRIQIQSEAAEIVFRKVELHGL